MRPASPAVGALGRLRPIDIVGGTRLTTLASRAKAFGELVDDLERLGSSRGSQTPTTDGQPSLP